MARWENEDVSDLNLPDPIHVVRVFFDKHGKETDNEEIAFAKKTINDDKELYHIKYSRGEIIDPHHIDSSIRNTTYPKTFKKVNKQAFDSYIKFLQTKNRLYFTMARRIVMEQI